MSTSWFPCQVVGLQTGSDALAMIQNAIKALPLTGGCVDARELTGTQTGNATVVVDGSVTLLLGALQIQLSASIAFLLQGNGNAPP